MEVSIFLAKVLGLYLTIFGVAMLYNKTSIVSAVNETFKNSATLLLLAVVTLIVGILLVVSHNVWVYDWPVIITVVAYLILIKGIMRLFFPDKVRSMIKNLGNTNVYYTVTGISLVIGVYLIYVGFGF